MFNHCFSCFKRRMYMYDAVLTTKIIVRCIKTSYQHITYCVALIKDKITVEEYGEYITDYIEQWVCQLVHD